MVATKPSMDKKAVLKSKIRDILSGRSRFVIRKVPAEGSSKGGDGQTTSTRVETLPTSEPKSKEEVKTNRCSLHIFVRLS